MGKGTSVNWPVGLGGKGNEGVAGTVGQNDGAIGYVELAYAKQNKLAYAKMKNAAGNVVEATAAATQNAMADFAGKMPDTLAVSIVNAPGAESWPIAGYTYLIIYMDSGLCTRSGCGRLHALGPLRRRLEGCHRAGLRAAAGECAQPCPGQAAQADLPGQHQSSRVSPVPDVRASGETHHEPSCVSPDFVRVREGRSSYRRSRLWRCGKGRCT